MLQYGEGITKAPLIWVHSLMALVLLFYFNTPGSQIKLDSHGSRILGSFQSLQVQPDVPHYSTFEKCNSVYCMFEGDFEFSHFYAGYKQPSSLLYVGSTAIGVAKRHFNRMAVYRRLKKIEFVDAELYLRYWASHNNLFDFVIVPLRRFADSAKLIRSRKMVDEDVYALIKLCRDLESSVRHKIHRILKSTVKFRGTMH